MDIGIYGEMYKHICVQVLMWKCICMFMYVYAFIYIAQFIFQISPGLGIQIDHVLQPSPTTFTEVFQNMFDYIDRIFAMVRPRKLLYMAIGKCKT